MDAAIKGRWVKALRSGEYRQCQNKLHDGLGFCCLGVLCDIEIDTDWVFFDYYWKLPNTPNSTIPTIFGSLPCWFRDKCDIRELDESHLTDMNDDGKAFAEIADWIEANL